MPLTPAQRNEIQLRKIRRQNQMSKLRATPGAMSASGIDLKLPAISAGYTKGEVPRQTITASGLPAGLPLGIAGPQGEIVGADGYYVDKNTGERIKYEGETYEDVGKGMIQEDYNRVNEYGEEFGVDVYKSIDEQLLAGINHQREQKRLAEIKLMNERERAAFTAEKSVEGLKSAADVGIGQLTPDREGFMSESNVGAKNKFVQAVEQQTTRIQNELTVTLETIDQAQKDLEFAQKQGDTEMIKQYSDVLSSAKQRAQLLDQQLIDAQAKAQTQSLDFLQKIQNTGVLIGASDEVIQSLSDTYGVDYNLLKVAADVAIKAQGTAEAQQRFDNQTKALATFQNLVTSGVEIPFDIFRSFSESTGLSTDALMGFNKLAQSVYADKTLGLAQKEAIVGQEFEKLSQMQKGVYTQAAQNIEFLKKLYREGASPGIISAFKSGAGITDYEDPITQAKLALDIAEARIRTNESNGVYNSPQDMLAYANARAVLSEVGLLPGAYLPGNPRSDKYTVVPVESGGILIEGATAGAYGGQCGKFVNDVLGTSVGDSIESKLKFTDSDIKTPTAGDLFVQRFPNSTDPNQYGHIGIVKVVDYENLRFQAYESNYHKNEKISNDRWISFSDVAGFGHPPKAIPTGRGGVDDKKTFDDFMNDPVTEGMTPKEKRAYAKTQIEKQANESIESVNYAGFEEEKNRLDRANAGESKQVRDGNIEAFNNAVRTGDPENVKMAIDEIERKKYLARTEPIQNDFETGTKDYNIVKDKVTQMQAIYDFYKNDPQQARTFIDQAVIILYNKILDPSSVVREAEYQRTPEDIAAVNRIYGYWDKIQKGGAGISNEDILNAVNAAQAILTGATTRFETEKEKAKRRAKAAGVPEEFLYATLGLEREKYGPPTPLSIQYGYTLPTEPQTPAKGYINYDQI